MSNKGVRRDVSRMQQALCSFAIVIVILLASSTDTLATRGRVKLVNNTIVTDTGTFIRGARVSLDIWDKTPTQADALAQAQRCTWTARNLYASAGRGGPCLPPTARMVTAMEFWQGTTVRTAYRQVSPMSSPRPVPISDRTRSNRFSVVEVEQTAESLASSYRAKAILVWGNAIK